MQVSETLNKAADLIEERGWAKGAGWPIEDRRSPADGALCLEGGIMAAAGIVITPNAEGLYTDDRFQSFWTCPAYTAVLDYLGDEVKRWLWAWNDRQRTAEQVIATLRAAAVIEAAKESAPAELTEAATA